VSETPVTQPAIQVFTLGQFRVLVGGRVVEDHAWRRRAARQLLKFLLSRSGRRATRDEVIDTFWPDSDPEAAASNLRSTLYALRNVLDSDTRSVGVVFADRDSVWLRSDVELWSDADSFEKAAADAFRSSDPLPPLESASDLYAGDYLPDDPDATWAAERRTVLKQTWTDLQLGLAVAAERRANVDTAVRAFERVLRADACNERAARELMQLLARYGRRAQAVLVYQRLVESLQAEFGIDPSPESIELNHQISAGETSGSAATADSFRCAYPFPLPGELIGRQPELASLLQLVRERRSAGKVAFVTAPAGTGKSALVGEVVRQAQAEGVLCLAGGCYEERGALPFGPFHDALVDYCAAQPTESLRRQLGSSSEDLAQVIPELRYQLQLSTASAPIDRMRAFGAIHACLRSLAERGPVLVCLEDLHAADDATLQVLHYLARQTQRLPLVLIGTFRSDEAPTDQSLAQSVEALLRERLAERVTLSPLTYEDADRLVAARLDGKASNALSESLYTTTGGNPLFLEQLLLALEESGQLERRGGVWHGNAELQGTPPIVREVIGQRLQRLNPECREVLAVASVLGQSFEHRTLLAAAEPLHETALLHEVDRAITAQILVDTPGGYAFRHSVVREAVYWGLTRPRRMLLHQRAAFILEDFYSTQADEHAAELAHHFGLAGEARDVRSKALHYNLAAGERAASVTAYAQALRHFSQACELIEHLQNVSLETRLDALEGRGRAERELYVWPNAVSTFTSILGLTSDTRRRARARSMLVGAMLQFETAGVLDRIEEGITELQHAALSDTETALAGLHLAAMKALIWFLRGKYAVVRAIGGDMLATAASLDQPLALGWAHSVLAWAKQGQGHVARALAEYEQALVAVQASQNKVQEAVVHVNLGEQFYRLGRFPQAQEHLSRAITLYEESTGELRTTDVLFREALLSLGQGDVERARAQAEDGLALTTDAGIRWAAEYHEVLGTIHSLQCEWDDAEASFLRSIDIHERIGSAAARVRSLLGVGLTYLRRGQVERAQASFLRALEICESIDPGLETVATLRHLATARLLVSDSGGAADYLSRSEALITREGLQDTLEYSPTLAVRGDLAAYVSDRASALEFAEQALTSAKTVESTVEASLRVALLLVASGQLDAAEIHAKSALAGAGRLGSPLLLGLAHRALAHVSAARNDFEGATASFATALGYLESARTPLELERVRRESHGARGAAVPLAYGKDGPP
jgi:DNA-binding SARP family transcriptional activator